MNVHYAVLFIMAKMWKQTKCLSSHEGINKNDMSMQLNITWQKNDILIYTKTWLNF